MNLGLPLKVIICISICLLLGIASGFVAGSATTEWYMNLNKPFFQPPSWIFGPAWTLLYTLMGIAVALVWHKSDKPGLRKTGISLFIFQFVLNLIWSPIFFYWENPLIALIVIVILWFAILMTIRLFRNLDTRAGYLMVPYLCWVTFATLLNASIVYLN